MTPEEAVARVMEVDPRFRVRTCDIRGIPYRVFANAPPDLRAFVEDVAARYGARDALVYEDQRWTYARLRDDVRRAAVMLATRLHVRPGDRVALALRNYPELPILILAVAAIGAVAVPLNAWWTGEELHYALRDCGARVAFVDTTRRSRIQAPGAAGDLELVSVRDAGAVPRYEDLLGDAGGVAWPDVRIDPDDDFAVIYSSGSTGPAKGVVLTHRGAISAAYSWLMTVELAPLVMDPPPPPPPEEPAVLVATPLFHVTALHANLLLGLANGAKVVLMYRWDADAAVRLIQAEGVTRVSGVPIQSVELLEAAERASIPLSTLRTLSSGGDKRPAAQVGPLARALPGAMIGTGWGMTETNALGLTLSGPDYVAHPEAAGRPVPPLQDFRIVDDAGRPVPAGAVGELTVKSPTNMRCYWNRPAETAETVREGWLYTGDLARVDGDGLFYIVGRKKGIIIRGGENISTLEVEGALYRHPAVAEAAVFAVPDARLGETVGAAIHVKSGQHLDATAIGDFLLGHLARFKVPEHVWIRDRPLPRTGTGKLDRRALRAECLQMDRM